MSSESLFNFSAPITDATSYGLVALNIIRHSNCYVFPINGSYNISVHYEYRDEIVNKITILENMLSGDFNPNLPSVRLFHQFSLAESIGRGKRIGWPIFELDTFTKKEVAHLNSCDELIVCSQWAVDILNKNNIKPPSRIVPLGVDASIFNEGNRELIDKEKITRPYIFFSCGKYEVRKGQDLLVEAFNKAFEKHDNVQLWISMHNRFMTNNDLQSIKNSFLESKLGSKIKFAGPFSNQTRLAECMRFTDCGVFPSSAEGWGLETLEMMACNKPVIVSNCTAHTEYCTNQNSFLVDIDGYVSAYDGKWFFNQGKWASLNIDSLISKMRYVYNNNVKSNERGLETARRLSWENSSNLLERLLYE